MGKQVILSKLFRRVIVYHWYTVVVNRTLETIVVQVHFMKLLATMYGCGISMKTNLP